MAAVAETMPSEPQQDDRGFFLGGAIAMAATIAAGFSINVVTGRSSFAAPLVVHAHALVFMGWVAIYLAQNLLARQGNFALHRRLGWLATGWVVLMLIMGCVITAFDVRTGRVPFFFQPLQFLVFDPVSLFAFAGLTWTAVALRKQTDWHRRLHFCAMAMLAGPGVGRILPMPLLAPWAWEATFVVCLIFPLAGIIADLRRTGRVHPGWWAGLAVTFGVLAVTEAVTYSPAGTALYQAVAAGSPGAAIAPLAFPAPPGPPPGA